MARRTIIAIAMLLGLMLLVSGCVSSGMHIVPEYTLAPTVTPTPEPVPSPTPELTEAPAYSPTPAPVSVDELTVDAAGNSISGAGHYMRYISFGTIQVYEQHGGSFVDAIAVNDYPEPITCAVSIVFSDDAGTVASARLQMRDGRYLLTLEPGENAVFATVSTDMRVTDCEFTIVYEASVPVEPVA